MANDSSIFRLLQRFSSTSLMRPILNRIRSLSHHPICIMEVCGGQTFALARYGIETLLPPSIRMIHGPGCPVCVTPCHVIDHAVHIALRPDVIFCTFGDMMRVPGSRTSLLTARSKGADIRIFYSPLDVLELAKAFPHKHIVFFAIGFETTLPTYALLLEQAVTEHIDNISLLTALFSVPAAVYAIASDSQCRLNALLAAGHVCAVTGTAEYVTMAQQLKIPVVVTGFEPIDLLLGILRAVGQFECGSHNFENAYSRVVCARGNPAAKSVIYKFFRMADATWRGFGVLPRSGFLLRPEYEHYDACKCFPSDFTSRPDSSACIAGSIMKGLALPSDCKWFGNVCSPLSPLGAPMVSSEGVCAAYYKYKLFSDES